MLRTKMSATQALSVMRNPMRKEMTPMTPHESAAKNRVIAASPAPVRQNGLKPSVGIIRRIFFIAAWLAFLPITAAVGAFMAARSYTHGYFAAYPGRGNPATKSASSGAQQNKTAWIH
jgi:hypothetical protein